MKFFEKNDYTDKIRIKPEKLDWLRKNKGTKTQAAFLDEILENYIKPDLFKKSKQHLDRG
jgi:hypothetical protein